MRIAIYVRVSTLEQAESGYSIDEQISKLKSFCDIKDWQVFDIYKDGGFSGSSLERPAMQKLISDAKRKKFDGVLVYKLDRLSRSQRDTLFIIEEILTKNDVAFISLNENFDTATPFGKAMIGILAVFAQLEREQISERMKMGKLGRAKSGKAMSWIVHPFGYDYIDDSYVINEFEATIVKEMFEWYLINQSVTGLAIKLNSEGHIGKTIDWSYRTVKGVLSNPVYAGINQFKGEEFQGNHEPIIDTEMFNKAQDIMAKKQRESSNSRPFESKYMLSGLIRCGECGSPMMSLLGRVKLDGTRTRSYRCKSYKKYNSAGKSYSHLKCNSETVRMDELEIKVLAQMEKLRMNPEVIDSLEEENSEDKIMVYDSELERLNTQMNKLLDLYMDGDFDRKSLDKRKATISRQIESIYQKIESLQLDEVDQAGIDATETLSKINSSVFELNYDEKKQLVNTLVDQVVVLNGSLAVHWAFERND